jgi:hypothetical protein
LCCASKRLSTPLERDWTKIAVFEMPAGEPARALTDQHRTGLGHRLQTPGQVRCLPNDRLLLRGSFADQIAHDDGAGGDANADMQLGADIRL